MQVRVSVPAPLLEDACEIFRRRNPQATWAVRSSVIELALEQYVVRERVRNVRARKAREARIARRAERIVAAEAQRAEAERAALELEARRQASRDRLSRRRAAGEGEGA